MPSSLRRKAEEGWVSLKEITWRLNLPPKQVMKLAGRIGLEGAMVRVNKCRVKFEEKAAEAACNRFLELKARLMREGTVRLGRLWGTIVAERLAREREA
jgi:hypothetical protein